MWPTPQDYNEAIQQPQLCFSDAELKKGSVELNHIGLPRSMTGAFASVYRVSNLSDAYAVRCFLDQRDDLKERYQAISAQFVECKRDWFVDFEFVEQGIKVLGKWYPILKMPWVEGEPLEKFLDRYVRNRSRVESLSQWFDKLLADLDELGIAHGDLQHGNILVTDTGLKLIDYDGMFVPALVGKGSPELGHRNFQHPGRTHEFYDKNLDNFAAWVISVSFKVLAIDPGLWRQFSCGDDCLLFRRSDFRQPESSPLFRILLGHESNEIVALAEKFLRLLAICPQSIPPLSVDDDGLAMLFADEQARYIERHEIDHEGHGRMLGAVDHAQWLMNQIALLESERELLPQRRTGKSVSKYARGLVDNFGKSMSHMGRLAWKRMVSFVARMQWVQEGLDEGCRAFNEGDYGGAIKIYSELAQWSAVAIKSSERDAIVEKAIEVFVSLGYCYVEIAQLGTAAHYFREAGKIAQDNALDEEQLRAALLLSATYFELNQKDRAITELERVVDSPHVLIGVVRREKGWSFGHRMTIPSMMVELGHKYLKDDKSTGATFCYEAAMESIKWLQHGSESQVNLIIARAATGISIIRMPDNQDDETIDFFRQHVPGFEQMNDLVLVEQKGVLAADTRYGNFMRLLAKHLDEKDEGDLAEIAYSAALSAYRTARGNEHQVHIAICLLGLSKVSEATNVLLSANPWKHGLSRELSDRLGSIQDYVQALIVATVVFNDRFQRNRYRCIDELAARCPSGDRLVDCLKEMESSRLADKVAFAELLLSIGEELKERKRLDDAGLHYCAAFRSFQRSGEAESYGTPIMECLLGSGDLDMAAGLLIDGGNLESTIKLLVQVMIGKGAYQADITTKVMLKVIEHQLSLPVAAVGEDELGKSLELLEWCAGEDSQIVAIQKDRVKQWFERRELNIAHNLVGQGQFGPAINIFEKYEGKDGPNVVSVLELWVMKYLMVALIEGDRLRVTTTDGYAFGCAIEIINTLKDRDVLRPEFAMQVAELIIKAAPWGMRQHIRQICTMFGSTGGEFLESAARLEAFCSSKSTSSYHLSSVVGKGAGSDAGSAGQSLDALNVDSDLSQLWTGLHRALFLIDREQYQEAIKVLTAFEKLDLKGEFLSDAYIGIGYCNYLLDDIESSEQFFKRAVHASRDRDRHKFYRAAVALAYFIKTPALSKPQLRKLVDPSVDYKEVLRIAAQLRGRPIDFNENLALNLANLLYGEASKTEQTQNTVNARARYKAALTIYGTEQEEFWSEVVDCLDAVGQYASAASRLKDATSRNLGMSDTAENLLMKIARRHVKEEQVSRILSFYESMGISLARYIDVAEREFIVQSLSKILISKVPPKRLLSQVTRDLNTMFSDDKLDPPFCITVARFIESNIVFCSEARRQKCREDLLKIGRVLSRVNSRALEVIQDCLKPSEEEKAGGEPKDGETIMESLF